MTERLSRVLLAALLALGVTSCATKGDALGSEEQNRWDSGFTHPIPIGEEWIMMWWLHNVSDSTILLIDASIEGNRWGDAGAGVGTVVQGVRFKVGHVGMPGGTYLTYPPSMEAGKRCRSFAPHPVAGYTLEPDEEAMILMQLRAVASGHFQTPGITVTYTQDGGTYRETIPLRLSGDVSPKGKGLKLEPEERDCLPPGGEILG